MAEEPEQDQCSPVSVLDPPFEDDDEQNRGDEEDEDDEDRDFDVECSYAIVQSMLLSKFELFLHGNNFCVLFNLSVCHMQVCTPKLIKHEIILRPDRGIHWIDFLDQYAPSQQ